VNLQHLSTDVLQVSLPVLPIILVLLRIKVNLQQNGQDLQHNLRSGPLALLWRASVQESGRLGSGEMLQVGPDLQHLELDLLQIRAYG
jgi:hypothetical protein